jgi:lysozyme family protein
LAAVVLSGGVRSIAEARTGGDYALAAVVLALGLVCFYPVYDLVRELRKSWRRRRFG